MLFEFFVAILTASLISAALAPVVKAGGLWDNPDGARKVHNTPNATAGGVAAAAGFAAALALLAFWPAAAWIESLPPSALQRSALAVGAAFCALMLGLIDDLRPIGPRIKFGCITGLGLFIAIFIARAETFPIAGPIVLPVGLVFGILGSALWVFTLANGVNFIDGANGLAMGSMSVGLLGMAALGLAHGAPHVTALSLCAIGGLVGFLVWNFPKGLIFAGDAGSLFIGVLAAAAALLLIRDGGVSPIIPPLLFFPILADVLLTLAFRVKHGRRVLEPHREHLYQVAMKAGVSHKRISLIYWVATAHCAAIAFVASFGPLIAPSAGFRPFAGDVSFMEALAMRGAAWTASLAPIIALVVLAWVSMRISDRVRRYAETLDIDQ